MNSLAKSVISTSAARIYALATGVGTLLVTARALGPSGRGIVASASAVALLLATLSGLSLGQVTLSRASSERDVTWLKATTKSLLIVVALAAVVTWTLGGVVFLSHRDFYGELPGLPLLIAFATIPLLIWEQYSLSLLTAIGQLRIYNRGQILGRTLGLLIVLLLLSRDTVAPASVLTALLCAQLVSAGAGFTTIQSLARKTEQRLHPTKALLTAGLKLHSNSVGTVLFSTGGILLLQRYRGPAETGQFQLALQLLAIGLIVPQAAAYVIYGEVARKGSDEAWISTKTLVLRLSQYQLLACIFALLVAPKVIPLLVGDDYSAAIPLFQILSLALLGQALSILMAPQWIGRGLFWQVSAISMAIGVATIVSGAVVIPRFGAVGAAWVTVSAAGVSLLANIAIIIWLQQNVPVARSQHARQFGPE